jgi:hypothetical protein
MGQRYEEDFSRNLQDFSASDERRAGPMFDLYNSKGGRTMRNLSILAIFLVSAAALFLCGCPPADGPGGGGADFDESKYYTKTEVTSYLDAAQPMGISYPQTVTSTNSSYATGVSFVGSASDMTGVTAAIIQVSYSHAAATEGEDVSLCIGTSASDFYQAPLPDMHNNELRAVLLVPMSSTPPRVWASSITAGASIQVVEAILLRDANKVAP